MKKLLVYSIGMMMLFAPLALATPAATKPGEIAAYFKNADPYGAGTLCRLMIVAYDATLWSDADAWSYAQPFALSLRYHIGFDSDQLVDRTIDEMKGQAELSAADEARYRTALANYFPSVKKGDRITALYQPPGKTVFFYNGTKKGEINDQAFAHRFFDIWLSDKTSEPSMRRKLLHLDD